MQNLALIGDIGGTNARFALTDVSSPVPSILHELTETDTEFHSLRDAAQHYLGTTAARPAHAVLAVASPVEGDDITLTNRDWSFNRGALQQALGLDHLQLINDFAAIAWAAPHLAAGDRVTLHGSSATPPKGPITLIGAGTGLGVALLTGSTARGWHVVPTEGGHASFAPTDDEERWIAAWLRTRHGRVSNERLLSGHGLSNIDAALRGVAPVAAPAPQTGSRRSKDVVDAALSGKDPGAEHALRRFCRIYGAVAGDAALLHGASTVLIAGGVVLHFLDYFLASEFMDAFTAKGRHAGYMQRMAVQVITNPNPGLLGAAVAVRSAPAKA
ncbi:MAG: glucokinase [Xanthomonadales bacterium]|nr:glucokinase [Xanthomonadales bacterium]ODU93685.1 MAG: glucokinase [Rhodanobacter sp. SCN 66-43]OJY83351.1 MAG: glucokinase [Xanthomonadales bacterium 66-474]